MANKRKRDPSEPDTALEPTTLYKLKSVYIESRRPFSSKHAKKSKNTQESSSTSRKNTHESSSTSRKNTHESSSTSRKNTHESSSTSRRSTRARNKKTKGVFTIDDSVIRSSLVELQTVEIRIADEHPMEEDTVEEMNDTTSKEQEQIAIKASKDKEDTVAEDIPAFPMSALAARRAGLYRTAPEVEEEVVETVEIMETDHVDQKGHYEEDTEDRVEEDRVEEDRVEEEEMEEDNESIEGDADTVESVPNAPASEGLLTPNEEDVYRPPKRTNQPLYDVGACSKFVSTKANTYVIRRKEGLYAFVGLKEGEDIVFAGQALVAPLFGSMLVQGAVISSGRSIPEEIPAANVCLSFYPVFSPKTHSLLRLQSAPLDLPAITAHKNTSTLKADLIQECLQALSKYSQFESILVIREYNVSQLQYISNCIPNTKSIFRLHSHTYESDSTSRLHHLMGFEPVLKPEEGIEALNISESWDQSVTAAMRNASERPTSMINAVIGGKNVGKSSFCRYLLNRLLASYETVAYIETDLGQGEFSPAGILSLHYISQPVMGPPFSHQHLEPARGFFIGSNSPKSHPDYYLACISELVDQWKHDNVKSVEDHHEGKKKCIPLILNTHGWISGLGYNLLTRQIQKSLPTDIFSVSSSARENKNVTSSLMMDILPAYHGIMDKPTTHNVSSHRHDPRYSVLSDIYTAATHREFTLASYFHLKGMDKKYEIKPKWDFQKHLVSKVPWMIDWRQGLNSVWVIYEEVKLNELLYTLNGSLVGLIGDVVDYEKQSGPNHPLPDSNIFTPPRYHNTVNDTLPLPESITCHGLAVVRSIDPSKHAFLLLTPLPESTLKKVSGMVKGELQIPLSFFLDNGLLRSRAVAGVSWDKVPYVVRGEYEGAGANTLKVRRNIQRRSLNT